MSKNTLTPDDSAEAGDGEAVRCSAVFGHWQPMETAPKTDRIMLCIGGEDWAIGSWNKDAFDGPRWEDDGLEPVAFIVQPTHWMPLPYLPPWSKWPNDQAHAPRI